MYKKQANTYGLRKTTRVWNLQLREALLTLEFLSCSAEKDLYTRGSMVITVYVDDMLFFGIADDIEVFLTIFTLKLKMSLTSFSA